MRTTDEEQTVGLDQTAHGMRVYEEDLMPKLLVTK
jgi:hypothetical protein